MAVEIPSSWPPFLWYVMELAIVLAVGAGLADYSSGFWNELGLEEQMINFVWWGIVGLVFVLYYLVFRRLLFKKSVLETEY